MPLNKLDSIIKNTEGRILYVSPADLDSTDSISNQGNSLARPFKTLQRALLESARFSYIKGNSNDETEKTTILLMPGEHVIDNRPGYAIDSGGSITTADGSAVRPLPLTLDTVFDLIQKDNDLYKFNSVNGGVIVPRGTSIVGLDLKRPNCHFMFQIQLMIQYHILLSLELPEHVIFGSSQFLMRVNLKQYILNTIISLKSLYQHFLTINLQYLNMLMVSMKSVLKVLPTFRCIMPNYPMLMSWFW